MKKDRLTKAIEAIQKIPRKPKGHRDNLLRAHSFGCMLKGHDFKDSVIMAETDIRELEQGG